MNCGTFAAIKFDSIIWILWNQIDACCTFATTLELSRLFGAPIFLIFWTRLVFHVCPRPYNYCLFDYRNIIAFTSSSHVHMHVWWNKCPHGKRTTVSPSSNVHKQIAHDISSSERKFKKRISVKTPNKTMLLQPYFERTNKRNKERRLRCLRKKTKQNQTT